MLSDMVETEPGHEMSPTSPSPSGDDEGFPEAKALAVASTALSSLGLLSLIRLFRGVDRSPAIAVILLLLAVIASIGGLASSLGAMSRMRGGAAGRGRGWAIAGLVIGALNAALIRTGLRLIRP